MPPLPANVRGRDLGSFVAELQRRINQGLRLPAGHSIDYGGQFENQQRAMRPLATVVIGGLITATILTLLLLPVLYSWLSGREPCRRAVPAYSTLLTE